MKNLKKSKIDKHGLCLNEYEDNINNAKVYFDRATGKNQRWRFRRLYLIF